MNSPFTGLRVASVLFGLMALVQLLRLILQPTVMVAGHLISLWPSLLAFLVLTGLCLWLTNLAHPHH